MLFRMRKHGAAEIIGLRNGHSVYRVDPTLMEDLPVKHSPGRGSDKGRDCAGRRARKRDPNLPDLSDANKAGSYDVISALLEAAGSKRTSLPSTTSRRTS